ncbi:hypothetical protein PsorP6_000498 [Peronosclerospora sorghi]|uniref:Uncharacterized protein n=1 Tax=Peronosclerospora sorghi TaxID=230839 RepID=A0ACC0WQE3_9STRA|nr:hypothetical protein PsorP6_000498 [Peronosclerospora sorghi]
MAKPGAEVVIDTGGAGNSEKGHGNMSVSYGLEQADDSFITNWIGTILGPAGTFSYVPPIGWMKDVTNPIVLVGILLLYFYPYRRVMMDVFTASGFTVVTKIHTCHVRSILRAASIWAVWIPQSGRVDPRRLMALGSWHRSNGIEHVLVAIRARKASKSNRRLPQPPEGSNFFLTVARCD